jgi:carbamoyltransferase
MWVLGVQKQADASVCLIHNGNLIYYCQEERLSCKKRDEYPYQTILEIKKFTSNLDFVVFSGYDYVVHENKHFFKYLKNLGIKVNNNSWIEFERSHHVAHAFNAFYNSGFSEAICVVCDGQGSEYKLKNGNSGSETTSVFKIEYPDIIYPIYKNIQLDLKHRQSFGDMDVDVSVDIQTSLFQHHLRDPIENCEISYRYDFDSGCMYQSISSHLGFGITECGKTMGLSAYGRNNKDIPPLILPSCTSEYYSNMNLFRDRGSINTDLYPFLKNTNENSQNLYDLCYHLQRAIEVKNLNIIDKALKKNLSQNLIITGGVALNVVANSFYKRKLSNNINLYIEPICEDYGNSIGMSKLMYYSKSKDTKIRPLETLYLGPTPEYKLELNNDEECIDNVEKEKIVDLLINQNIVAVFQGRSEAGPRALGNRSLLFDPRNPNGQMIVNRIKNREWFRPFAATILEEEANNWFDMLGMKDSPYMMFALETLSSMKSKIPSVVHIDGTCRVQTINYRQNKNFYELIKCFFSVTNVPMLLNTSFNLAGHPMVESVSDALFTLRNSNLEYLYLPDLKKLIIIKNKAVN